jgi:hypothetical protein
MNSTNNLFQPCLPMKNLDCRVKRANIQGVARQVILHKILKDSILNKNKELLKKMEYYKKYLKYRLKIVFYSNYLRLIQQLLKMRAANL